MKALRQGMMVAIGLLATPVFAEEESAWSIDAEVTGGYDDNVGRGVFRRDIVGEYIGNLGASLNYDWELGPYMAMTFRGFAETELHEQVKPLERTTAGGEAIFRWQGEFGFFEPFYQFSVRVQDDNYDVVQRDASVYTAHLQRTQRINARWTYILGVEHKQTDSDGTAFDLSGNRLFANIDYRVDSDWVGYSTLSVSRGDVVSTAQNRFCNGVAADDIYPLVRVSDAIEPDQAFNDTFCGSWLAYRGEADTVSVSLGLNRAFADTNSFDFSVMQIRSVSTEDRGLDYDRRIVRASILMRF